MRFKTYHTPVSELSKAYMETILNTPAVKEWIEGAYQETEVVERYERKK
jgi:glutathione S-transferase